MGFLTSPYFCFMLSFFKCNLSRFFRNGMRPIVIDQFMIVKIQFTAVIGSKIKNIFSIFLNIEITVENKCKINGTCRFD